MKYFLIFLSSLIVSVANADPLPKDVNVISMPPVSGSVEATITGPIDVNVPDPVQVEQAGEWNISVNNEADNPVPVTIVDQATGPEIVNRGAYGLAPGNTVDRFVVPPGKRFILTDLSVSPQMGFAPTPSTRIGFYINDGESDIMIREVFFGSGIHRAFETGYVFQDVVRVTNEASSEVFIIVAITGLLVDE